MHGVLAEVLQRLRSPAASNRRLLQQRAGQPVPRSSRGTAQTATAELFVRGERDPTMSRPDAIHTRRRYAFAIKDQQLGIDDFDPLGDLTRLVGVHDVDIGVFFADVGRSRWSSILLSLSVCLLGAKQLGTRAGAPWQGAPVDTGQRAFELAPPAAPVTTSFLGGFEPSRSIPSTMQTFQVVAVGTLPADSPRLIALLPNASRQGRQPQSACHAPAAIDASL